MCEVLPLYYWPPAAWVRQADRYKRFCVGYGKKIPKASLFYRCALASGVWLSIPLVRASKKAPWEATWPLGSRWRLHHWRTIQTLYGKAPFFYEWKPFLEALYLERPVLYLHEVSLAILQELARWRGWRIEVVEGVVEGLLQWEGLSSLPLLLRGEL